MKLVETLRGRTKALTGKEVIPAAGDGPPVAAAWTTGLVC